MAAPSLIFFPAPETLRPVPRLRRRGAALSASAPPRRSPATGSPRSTSVRVLGPEVKSDTSSVRLAIDLRDTGKDAWKVACKMAGRGFTLDAASNRVIVVRLTDEDVADATHHRLACALQLALWATPAKRERLSEHPAVRRAAPPRSARDLRPSGTPPRRAGPPDTSRGCTSPSFSSRPTVRDSALWLRCTAAASSCILGRSPQSHARRSSTSNSLIPSPCSSSASSSAQTVRACRESKSRHSLVRSARAEILPHAYVAHALDAHACMLWSVTSSSPKLGRPPLGRPDPAVRDRLPRRPRRLDGRRRAPLDPGRPRPHHLPARSGSSPPTCWASAACCCSAAARPTCSAGAAC